MAKKMKNKIRNYLIVFSIVGFLLSPTFLMGLNLPMYNEGFTIRQPLTAGTLSRTGYPIILDNNTDGGALWNALHNHHIDNIRLAYYDGSNWVLIPFQLDEMGYFRSFAYETGKHAEGAGGFDGGTQYTDQTNWGHFISDHRYVGNHVDDYAASATELSRYDCEMEFWAARAAEYYTDATWSDGDAPQATPPIQPDPSVHPYNLEQPGGPWEQLPNRIDYDDELCFNSYNGDQVDSSNWWNSTSFPHRYELAISDPVSGGGTGYMYLYYNDDTGNSPPANNYFMPNGISDDQVSWNPATQIVTGENYHYAFDSTNDQAYLGAIIVEGINMFTEWNKEWQSLELDIQRAGSTFNIGGIDSQSNTDTGRMGTWNSIFYDEIQADTGYGTIMDFDLQNLAPNPDIFPGQDADFSNGHRPWDQPLSGGQNHHSSGNSGWWDQQTSIGFFGVTQVSSWDDGMDHDGYYGSNSEHPPFVRGLLTFGNGHECAIDGPVRVVVDQFSLRRVQFLFQNEQGPNYMEYEEGLRFDRRSTFFFANEMREMPYEINLDYSGRGEGDPSLNVYMNCYYMFYAGTRMDGLIGLPGAQIRLGRAPTGYGYAQCDAVYDTVRTLTPDNSDNDYLSSSNGPVEGHFDVSSPLVSGNPLSDWRYVRTDTAGAWSYIPVQEMTQIFSGDTSSSLQWYWQDSGSITEMSIYGNDGATNSISGTFECLRTYFDDGSLTDTQCQNEYIFSKEGFSVSYTYQEAPEDDPPIKVSGLSAVVNGETQIDLTWDTNPEPDIDHYNIYRDGILLDTSITNTYSDTGLEIGTTYTYTVSAVDDSGNEGIQSDPASATTENYVPSQVTGLSAVAKGETHIDLTWDANPESDIDHYNIYRDGILLDTSISNTYSDTGLEIGTAYTYT
ncbi:MAG: hypothetical protein GF311_05060, partial [Candidatus Lokiarchaeota archaeon]|nr:hypothetical protein [Candidatus Lokiarchaeota archaeon]